MFKNNIIHSIVNILFTSLTILSSSGIALAADGAKGFAVYDRPHISTVTAKEAVFSQDWETLKKAHFDFVAFLLERYPTEDLYFLARDSEFLFDTAMLMAEPQERERLHLLNVSRTNLRDKHLDDYLKQEGISDESLSNGKKVVLIDTGFQGTIPEFIQRKLSYNAALNFKTQLIVSSNPSYPSSRVFLKYLSSLINEINPAFLHESIVSYERLPRFNARSDAFSLIDSRWVPISLNNYKDGEVDKAKALEDMMDLKATSQNKITREKFFKLRRIYKSVVSVFNNHDLTYEARISSLKKYTVTMAGAAAVRDLVDGVDPALRLKLSNDLGLFTYNPTEAKKLLLTQKYPKFKYIIDDPKNQIDILYQNENAEVLKSLIRSPIMTDVEISHLIFAKIKNENPLSKLLLREIIQSSLFRLSWDKPNSSAIFDVLTYVYSANKEYYYKDEMKLMIDVGTPYRLLSKIISRPGFKDVVDYYVEKRGLSEPSLWNLPYIKEYESVFTKLIEVTDIKDIEGRYIEKILKQDPLLDILKKTGINMSESESLDLSEILTKKMNSTLLSHSMCSRLFEVRL